jgi:hypothetical protein
LLALFALFAFFALPGRTARGDEVAPGLEGADLRYHAEAELGRLVLAMPASDRRRLAGAYVAFDDDMTDPSAQVACDDDGDYVIVFTEAMLRLAAHLARAATCEEAEANAKIDAYASFVARSQIPGRRLVPPPAGFYVDERPSSEEHLGDVLSFLVARELAHLQAGDLVCPNPTATKESGDAVWTAVEKRKALDALRRVYAGRPAERDAERDRRAAMAMFEVGRTEKGAVAVLRFFAHFELEGGGTNGRFLSGYAVSHPGSSAGMAVLAVVRRAASAPRP